MERSLTLPYITYLIFVREKGGTIAQKLLGVTDRQMENNKMREIPPLHLNSPNYRKSYYSGYKNIKNYDQQQELLLRCSMQLTCSNNWRESGIWKWTGLWLLFRASLFFHFIRFPRKKAPTTTRLSFALQDPSTAPNSLFLFFNLFSVSSF